MYISIDVGGTNMRVALVDLEGEARIVKLESHPVPQDYHDRHGKTLRPYRRSFGGPEDRGHRRLFSGHY